MITRSLEVTDTSLSISERSCIAVSHDLSRLPKVKDLNAEFSALVAEKRAAYAEYRAIRDEHRELLIHRHNVETFLGEEKSTTDRRARDER